MRAIVFTLTLLLSTVSAAGQIDRLLDQFFSPAEMEYCNTAHQAEYMTVAEQQFLQYLNLARIYPAKFAEFYLAYLKEYDPDGLRKYKRRNRYYYGLYKDLTKLPEDHQTLLLPDPQMFQLAACWAKESGRRGKTGHKRRRCTDGYDAECCSYIGSQKAMDHLILLLVDEDIRDLGHRKVMLGKYQGIGISIQPHKEYGYCAVLDFSKTASGMLSLD